MSTTSGEEPIAQSDIKSENGQKGQVALFIALIFQVLFVFFAMMINVGLLVHHKINLQNSVDLSAYYAGTKQAETLNAIAHVNYQIHQSWKLLNFRYRHLGEYGDSAAPAYPGQSMSSSPGPDTPTGIAPVFCVAYGAFQQFNGTETYCKSAGANAQWVLQHPPIPSFGNISTVTAMDSGFGTFVNTMTKTFENIQDSLQNSCSKVSAVNLFALMRFIVAYKRDMSMRKRLLISLANNMSQADPIDLDGNKVSDGIKQTLIRNLTYQNKDSLRNVQMLNSLSNQACGVQSGFAAPKWLSEINVYPFYYAYMADCTLGSSTFGPTEITAISSSPGTALQQAMLHTQYGPGIKAMIPYITDVNTPGSQEALYNTTLGYEKNPWCMGYSAISAETAPKIPFSPFGAVTLKAVAYVKPFGATIGPWFSSQWPSGASPNSSGGTPVEKASGLTRWIVGGSVVQPNPADANSWPVTEYSRYVGDKVGTKSALTSWAFGSALTKSFLGANIRMSLTWWNQLTDPDQSIESVGKDGDALAFDPQDPNSSKMRDMEIAAIAPDNFDMTYYTIEPDFYRNYMLRMTKNGNPPTYLQTLGGRPIRADLGARANDGDKKTYNVKRQIEDFKNTIFFQGVGQGVNYFATSFTESLTSFKEWVSGDTQKTWDNFGKCPNPAVSDNSTPTNEKATTGNCVAGGRLGYSVKLVDGDYLINGQSLPLGGTGTSGSILNPTTGPGDAGWISVP